MKTLLGVFVLSLLAGCGSAATDPGSSSAEVSVVAAFYPLAEAAEQVGGDRVEVANLTPSGAEPHDLELTPSQRDAVEDADLVVVLGRGFQPEVEDAAAAREGSTLAVLDRLGASAGDDPHVWLDPVLFQEVIGEIAEALAVADPEGAGGYQRRAATYNETVAGVDRAYQSGLAECESALLVTAHEAFGHLADRYGLEQHAIAGLSPDQEPNADRIAELADLVEAQGVTTIFTEELVSPTVAETLAREAGVEIATLDPLEGLADADAEAGRSYVSIMEDNLAALVTALRCS